MFSKSKIKRYILLSVLSFLAGAVTIGIAFADDPRTTYIGWVGTSVVAQKDVTRSGNTWNGRLWSHTQSGNAIGTIGWTYWTHRERCNSTIGDNYVHPGYAQYGSNGIWDIGVDSYSPCSGTRRGEVLGNHEFKHQIGSQYYEWYKDWVHSEVLQ